MNEFFLTADERRQITETLNPEGQKTFSEIVANYKTDLSANARFRVSPSEQLLVWSEAGLRLRTQILHEEAFEGRLLGHAELSEIWHSIVADYHLTRGWKHKVANADEAPMGRLSEAREASEIKADESRAIFREMWPLIWKFVVLALLLKIVILYLGGHGYLYWGNG